MGESRIRHQSKDIKEKGHLVDLGIDGNVISQDRSASTYESWNFNSGNYLFTTDTK